ncbi:MAG: MBL fold metallo-hydrolase [Mesorhizobium sp.]|nr:MBL fold metallo-hydrolase [Mesorhizobium sp.]MCO5164100.1 MBL fold metallo-hydrolase [Mesorhizobium sp.]
MASNAVPDGHRRDTAVTIPFAAPSEFGTLVEVAPGILWAQLPLPYQPGSVNTYLIADGDGWCAVDAGLLDDDAKATWEKIVAALPGRRKVSSVLITHWHSDHSGAAAGSARSLAHR